LWHLLPMSSNILWRLSRRFSPFAEHVNLQSLFIDLCDSFDEDGMLAISLYPSKSSLQMNYFPSTSANFPFSSIKLPSAREDHPC
jgi:hypothetical protein